MIDVLILASALAQTAQRSVAVDRIELGVVANLADGSTRTTSSVPGVRLLYASAENICDTPATSTREPAAGALGWKVEVEPIPGDARIVWRRLAAVANHQGAKNGLRTLPTAGGRDWTALDHLDIPATAGCKVSHWSLVARRVSEPAVPAQSTGIRFVARIAYPDGRIDNRTVKTVLGAVTRAQSFYVSVPASVCEGWSVSDQMPSSSAKAWHIGIGPVKYAPESRTRVHAEVMITAQDARRPANFMKVAALPTQTTARTEDIVSVTGLRPVGGCNAVAVTLQARLLPEAAEVKAEEPARLLEAELWFVHKAPDGKETSTRQTVRVKNGTKTAGGGLVEFYFDDLVVNANVGDRTEPVTVEVFGSLLMYPVSDDREVTVGLTLTRRYVNPKAVAVGLPPTVGKGNHHLTVQMGEVVSFVLPPVEGDKGHFLGHRFSVRLRMKPVE